MELKNDLAQMTTKELVSIAKTRAEDFSDHGLKTNQIRNFYSAITKMKIEYKQDNSVGNDLNAEIAISLTLLKPKLAYAAGRQKAVRRSFQPFLTQAIEAVEKSKNPKKALENFFVLVESIVAYHKFFGGE